MDAAYTFRPYTSDDIEFIQSSWGHSYYNNVFNHKFIPAEEFHKYHRPIRENILNRPTATIIICCSSKEPTLILGYSIVEEIKNHNAMILHYIYVKSAFRAERNEAKEFIGSQRIGSQLLEKSIVKKPVLYTHQTIASDRIFKKYKNQEREELKRFLFAPHLI